MDGPRPCRNAHTQRHKKREREKPFTDAGFSDDGIILIFVSVCERERYVHHFSCLARILFDGFTLSLSLFSCYVPFFESPMAVAMFRDRSNQIKSGPLKLFEWWQCVFNCKYNM